MQEENKEETKGPSLSVAVKGDFVLLHDYGGTFKKEKIARTTKPYIFLRGYKFKRSTGKEVENGNYVWILQYDPAVLEFVQRKTEMKNKRSRLRQINWGSMSEEQIETCYAALAATGLFG
jgi:hypothetical protein